MALLYGRAGRLTAKNGGFRPGQYFSKYDEDSSGELDVKECGRLFADLGEKVSVETIRMIIDTKGVPTAARPCPAPRPARARRGERTWVSARG